MTALPLSLYNTESNQNFKVNTFLPHANKEDQTEGSTLSSKEQTERRVGSESAGAGDVSREALPGIDAAVDTSGEVSEILREAGEHESSKAAGGAADQTVQAARQPVDLAKIREQLLQNLPGADILRKQIEKEIKKEIDYLHKRAMKMLRRPGKINYFEMNNILSKIRDLRGVLAKLIKASVESLKTLWLRYVHGIM